MKCTLPVGVQVPATVAGALVVAELAVAGCSNSTAHTESPATTVTSAATTPTTPAPTASGPMPMPTTSPTMSLPSVTPGPAVRAGRTGRGAIGPLTVTGAYIPAPASPSVAAAYFRVSSTSDTPDALVSVTTPVSAMATLHRYAESSSGGMMMVPLTGGLPIPAHGSAQLLPGQSHLRSPRQMRN